MRELRIVDCLRLFIALEQPVAGISPQFAQRHTFVVGRSGKIGRQRIGRSGVFGNLALAVPDGEFQVVAEIFSAHFEIVAPRNAGLPTVGTHIRVVAFGGRVAEYGGKFASGDVHIGRILAIDIAHDRQAAVEHLPVDTDIVGRCLLPCQTVGIQSRFVCVDQWVSTG